MNVNRRLNTIQEARQLLEYDPVYLDTETTGLHQSAEVIEIGIINDQGVILFEQRIRPRGKIDPAAERLHGITQAMLADCPTWEQVWPQAEAVLMDKKVGVYNVEFDLRLIKQSNQRTWMRSSSDGYQFLRYHEAIRPLFRRLGPFPAKLPLSEPGDGWQAVRNPPAQFSRCGG